MLRQSVRGRLGLTHKCASFTTFMILAMNASMWKIFFEPWRMRSSWGQLSATLRELT